MNEEEEVMRLRQEVEMLKKKKEMLQEINRLKLERLKQAFSNLPARIQANHPVLSYLGQGFARGAREVGRNVISNADRFAGTKASYERYPEQIAKPVVRLHRLKKVLPKRNTLREAINPDAIIPKRARRGKGAYA